MRYVLFFLYIVLFSACDFHKKKKKEMIGYWSIDFCLINGQNYADNKLSTNSIVFNQEDNCSLPQFYVNDFFIGDERAKWRLIDSLGNEYIVFENTDNLLAGTYRVYFDYNSNKKLQNIFLESNMNKIELTKALANW